MTRKFLLKCLPVMTLVCSIFSAKILLGQAKPLITAPLDKTKLVSLAGNVRPAIQKANDLGVADSALPAGRLLLILKRPAEQEAALQSFLHDAHSQGSASFHKWMAPGQFGQQFGIADSDVEQITAWLQSQGLTVSKLSAGKTALEFTGTIGQVNGALHTSIHKYSVNGATHYANASDPQIPAAFSAAIGGITQLDDFKPKSQAKVMGQSTYNPATHQGTPQWTYPTTPTFYFLTPEDFSTQYDAKPAYAAGTNGAGQTIGIINDSNIDISMVNAYRKLFGLPVNPPQVVIDGLDPGPNGDAIEAYLDVENAGAVAPNATIKLYIGGSIGILGGGGVDFAMLRAVDDDIASVLSLSFGTCEEQPTSGNEFINAVWEQAAAQGQTVFVSAGDSGSKDECTGGLGVNALASTPWDIAVGGSDFYFSDYATGGASIANYWNKNNDANLGSLLKPMSEQPWNGTIYGLNSIVYDPPSGQIQYGSPANFGAGGGGASACAVTNTVVGPYYNTYTCVSGYPKPSWQTGAGVPQDSVRDLPDVSLFASNGYNGVTWPICALPGDCTATNPANNALFVTGVGGTSASSPAMAGVMALIDQKYGPQGQANYVLYPLAAQFPSVINPIDVGSNNEPCYGTFEPNCTLDTNGDGYYSLQNYSAGPGYDQASGLGSVDINGLLTNWNSITFKPSTTSLNLTPTSIVHGQNVAASVVVTGTGTPSGSVSLITTSSLPGYKGLTNIPLGSNGIAQTAIDFLPGGTYNVYAQFSGDGVNGPSKSSTVSMTVTPEASTATLTGTYQDPTTYQITQLVQNAVLPYGTGVYLDVTVLGAASPTGSSDGQATGTVTFMDGTTVAAVIPVTSSGQAEFFGGSLAVGTHTITAIYSGDASFKTSTSTAIKYSVAQSQSSTQILIDPSHIGYDPNNNYDPIYAAGQTIQMGVTVGTGEYGNVPTGTVIFQYDSAAPVTMPLAIQNLSIFGDAAYAALILPNLTTGMHTLTVTYSGDANYATSTGSEGFEVQAATLVPTTTQLAIVSPAAGTPITPGTVITFQATVTGSGTTAPTGTITLFSTNLLSAPAQTLVPGPGNTSTATIVNVVGADLVPYNNPLFAKYSGDSVYNPSSSNVISVFNDPSDFSIETQTGTMGITSGQSGTATIGLASENGLNGTIALTCMAPGALVCTLNPASVVLNGVATTTVTINTTTTLTTARNESSPKGSSKKLPWSGFATGSTLACVLFCFLPSRRRRHMGRVLFGLMALILVGSGMGCGKSGPTVTTPLQPITQNAAPGSYTVVVSGVSPSGIAHNTTITVIVQ